MKGFKIQKNIQYTLTRRKLVIAILKCLRKETWLAIVQNKRAGTQTSAKNGTGWARSCCGGRLGRGQGEGGYCLLIFQSWLNQHPSFMSYISSLLSTRSCLHKFYSFPFIFSSELNFWSLPQHGLELGSLVIGVHRPPYVDLQLVFFPI